METEASKGVKRKRASGDSKDKRIKIKLTTSGSNGAPTPTQATLSGSEDEDELEATIEEHLILRMPPGESCERLREYVRKREIPEDVKMQFKDSRHGYFYIDGKRYNVTLMDLPTITESQKTLDKKQFFKVADISQMLLVEGEESAEDLNRSQNADKSSDPYSYPHGLGPPLKHVRKRRFRKKLSKRAIEEVEREVERLLEVDATAEDVQYETLDTRDMEMENESDVGTQDIEIDTSEAGESESDEDLAAAIDRDLEQMAGGRDEDDEDENDDEEEESEEEEEEEEGGETGEIEQKRQEIAEIKQLIQRKTHDLLTAPNAILKKRFETSIENLKKELTLKEAHLAEMSKAASSSSS